MEPGQDRLVKDAKRVLKHPFWIPELSTNVLYERIHDDDDGTKEGRIMVTIGADGDSGMSPHVRNALMILALAIKMDNEECPQE